MIEGRRITVVVPAYQEEALIERTLGSIPIEVDRVLVVDDGSTDSTSARVRSHADPRVVLIRREDNGGVGAAIATGYQAFLDSESGDAAICVVMAGDAQMDPADLPSLLAPILQKGAGYSKGNRLLNHHVTDVMPKTRFLGNLLFTMFTKIASGYWHVMDSQCGYAAITRDALSRIDVGRLYPRYGFPNDLLVRLNVARVRIADVPVRAIYGDEKSGINPWVVIPKITFLLLRGFWWRLWRKHVVQDFHPLAALYVLGTLLLIPGLALAVVVTCLRLGGSANPSAGTSILVALLILLGCQCIFFGMLFDMHENQHLKVDP